MHDDAAPVRAPAPGPVEERLADPGPVLVVAYARARLGEERRALGMRVEPGVHEEEVARLMVRGALAHRALEALGQGGPEGLQRLVRAQPSPWGRPRAAPPRRRCAATGSRPRSSRPARPRSRPRRARPEASARGCRAAGRGGRPTRAPPRPGARRAGSRGPRSTRSPRNTRSRRSPGTDRALRWRKRRSSAPRAAVHVAHGEDLVSRRRGAVRAPGRGEHWRRCHGPTPSHGRRGPRGSTLAGRRDRASATTGRGASRDMKAFLVGAVDGADARDTAGGTPAASRCVPDRGAVGRATAQRAGRVLRTLPGPRTAGLAGVQLGGEGVRRGSLGRRCHVDRAQPRRALAARKLRPRGLLRNAARRRLRGGGAGWRGRIGGGRAGRRGCAGRRRPRRNAAALLLTGSPASGARVFGRERGCSRLCC